MATIIGAVRRAAPHALALFSPKQQVSLTYAELDDKVRRVARGLRELNVNRNDVVVSDIPNTAENVILQLALSHLGAIFATAKDVQSLSAKVTGTVVCSIAGNGESWMANRSLLPSSVKNTVVLDAQPGYDKLGHISFEDLEKSDPDGQDAAAAPDGLAASYNGAAMTHKQAAALGQNAAKALSSAASDKSCVSITLCHAFGFGSGVGSALLSGGAIVLPAAGGIRGCGDPKQRASVTGEVLAETGATLLFADTHILKQLAKDSVVGGTKLRGGVVKIGSGTDIFDDGTGMEYAGAALLAMGKKP